MAYYRSLVEYQLAIKNVQVEKGTLLDYNEIFLNEGAWPTKAYEDAEARESTRGTPHNYTASPKKHSPWVSQGMYPQMLSPSGGIVTRPQPVPYAPSTEATPADPTLKPSDPTPVEYERGTSSLPTTDSSADLRGPAFNANSTPLELPIASPE